MLRPTWKSIAVWAGAVLLVLVAGVLPKPLATAQDASGAQAELMERLHSDGLTREELAGFYRSLAGGEFEPPACVVGGEMFTDVPATSSFCPWIEELARRGVTSGCTATQYCPGNPVTRDQMAVFVVRAVADEAFHLVGAPGEPLFGNGVQGDCLWQNPPPDDLLAFVNPVSFFKDSDGIVHLAGVPAPFDGPGGDTVCDNVDISDNVIFVLPAGYQPKHLEIFVSANASVGGNLIIPEGGVTIEGMFVQGGSVLAANVMNGNFTTLDGITFRAAPETTTLSQLREPANVSLQALRDLLD